MPSRYSTSSHSAGALSGLLSAVSQRSTAARFSTPFQLILVPASMSCPSYFIPPNSGMTVDAVASSRIAVTAAMYGFFASSAALAASRAAASSSLCCSAVSILPTTNDSPRLVVYPICVPITSPLSSRISSVPEHSAESCSSVTPFGNSKRSAGYCFPFDVIFSEMIPETGISILLALIIICYLQFTA